MSRCKETAGVLFKHPCDAEADSACVLCRKPVCAAHRRGDGYQTRCISCLRKEVQQPSKRASRAHLRDDPYFYWYYEADDLFDDPYGADDYALFDQDASGFADGVETEWEGS